ncbi:S1C family serine protease [Salinispora arenicola]|uniref:S1C family serine protease n=1 Tax=Salinispora arenicola TaxID=168697 RepID=UPI001691E924|nr:S1C family serine protease [Salinispora arenicola]NIL63540.1 serine protease [Salinispora arenicola]
MTSGHGRSGAGEDFGATPADDTRDRPGPWPPAVDRPPVQPPPIAPAPPADVAHGTPEPARPTVAPPRTTWSPPPQPGPSEDAPAAPVAAAVPGVPTYGGPGTPGAAYPPLPGSGGPPPVGPPPGGPGGIWPGAAHPVPVRAPRPFGLLGWVAVLAIGALLVVTGVQAYQIHRLTDRLADTDRRLNAGQEDSQARLDGLEARAKTLESEVGAAFDPEVIAAAALPSVFRVRAGRFTGSAFAVGESTAGGTNLFTNFHVVEGVWDDGDREVFLERTDQRFPATIVEVDKDNDIAQLRTTGKFTGLTAAPGAVKPGQQIVVVGAPLGLADSVTTGVVSAFREAKGGDPAAIQFDAPINPGNSGGPVVNGERQVVGIATAKARDAEGIGLAVPIGTACEAFDIC